MNANKLQTIAYYSFGALIAFLLFLILKPFLMPLFWAAVFSLILYPIHKWLTEKSKSRNIGAALTIVLGTTIVIVILTILTGAAISSIDAIYPAIRASLYRINLELANIQSQFSNLSFLLVGKEIIGAPLTERLYSSIAEALDYSMRVLSNIGANILLFSIKLFVMLYTLYFFLRDGEKIIAKGRDIVPTGSKMDILIFQRFPKAAKGALKTTLVMGSLQGLVGGLLFYLAGIKGAVIWGFLLALASLIPSFSCAVIWLPAGITMLFLGDLRAGMVVLLGGVFVITPIDYFLRPLIIGKDIGVHPLLIFLSSLGGIMFFGFSGLIIGPIIAALATSLWETFLEREPA